MRPNVEDGSLKSPHFVGAKLLSSSPTPHPKVACGWEAVVRRGALALAKGADSEPQFDASLIGPLRFVNARRRSRRSSLGVMTEFGRSSHAGKHKFKESAYFRRRQMPRREVRIERKMLLRPIREDLDQFAAFQQRIKTEGEALRDAVPSRAGIELGG